MNASLLFLRTARMRSDISASADITRRPTRAGGLPQIAALLMAAIILMTGSPAIADAPNLLPPPKADLSGNTKPPILKDVGIDQNLQAQVPRDLVFRDETGKQVTLGSFFGKRPLILALVYFNCPSLCTLSLNDLTRSINSIDSSVGKDFDILTVSFDPDETYQLAAAKKHSYLSQYRRPTAAAGWHFLTGDAASIRELTNVVGFRYVPDPHYDKSAVKSAPIGGGMGPDFAAFGNNSNKFAHASGIIILTPQGKVSRYFFGIDYAPKDLELALDDASHSKIGSLTETILQFCFHYDPSTGKYTLSILKLIKIAGIITLGLVAGMWLVLRRGSHPVLIAPGDADAIAAARAQTRKSEKDA